MQPLILCSPAAMPEACKGTDSITATGAQPTWCRGGLLGKSLTEPSCALHLADIVRLQALLAALAAPARRQVACASQHCRDRTAQSCTSFAAHSAHVKPELLSPRAVWACASFFASCCPKATSQEFLTAAPCMRRCVAEAGLQHNEQRCRSAQSADRPHGNAVDGRRSDPSPDP